MTPEQEKKLNEVHQAIIGNPAMGQAGIIPRIQELEKHKSEIEKWQQKILGMIMIGTPVITVIVAIIKHYWFG